ncbi:MAG: serine/threonine protein kinase [Deltaproteobacteria bacterium]|nr:serine/threonine protein kinase [Deltaproteobacteria bacterium]
MVTESSQAPELGTDRYKLLEPAGQGGIAVVWKALDQESQRYVAVKLMQPQAVKLEAVQRLAQEATILAELNHPAIVQLIATGVADDESPFVVMEWVHGVTLRALLVERKMLPPHEMVKIMSQLAGGLTEAHSRGVIHRDLKPENVMLKLPERLQVKIVDFGMAKILRGDAPYLTQGMKICGTPQYMSPERARGKAVAAAADVYALAIIAYEILAGRRPFDAKGSMDVLMQQVNDDPPPIEGVHSALQGAIFAALAKDPDERPSADEFARRIKRAASRW